MMTLDEVLAPIGTGASTVAIPPEWGQGRAAFGGLVGAVVVRAAEAVVPADRAVRSVLVDFAAPIGGEVSVVARLLREGRSLSHVEVRLAQDGQDLAVALVAAGTSRPSAVALASPGFPEGPLPDAGVPVPFIDGVTPAFVRNLEHRWGSTRFPFSGSDRANLGGWFRYRDGLPVDAARLVALLDGWPPPVLTLVSRPVAASTVTWLANLVAPLPPGGWPGDGWFRFESDSVAAAEGYADLRASLWAPDGRLVATSSQLVAEFSA